MYSHFDWGSEVPIFRSPPAATQLSNFTYNLSHCPKGKFGSASAVVLVARHFHLLLWYENWNWSALLQMCQNIYIHLLMHETILFRNDVHLTAVKACPFKITKASCAWNRGEKQTAAGLTEQFQIALMVEWAKGVGNGPRFTTDSWGERGGRGGWRYSDVVRKLGYVFSKQFLSCHWKEVVKFRSLKRTITPRPEETENELCC